MERVGGGEGAGWKERGMEGRGWRGMAREGMAREEFEIQTLWCRSDPSDLQKIRWI